MPLPLALNAIIIAMLHIPFQQLNVMSCRPWDSNSVQTLMIHRSWFALFYLCIYTWGLWSVAVCIYPKEQHNPRPQEVIEVDNGLPETKFNQSCVYCPYMVRNHNQWCSFAGLFVVTLGLWSLSCPSPTKKKEKKKTSIVAKFCERLIVILIWFCSSEGKHQWWLPRNNFGFIWFVCIICCLIFFWKTLKSANFAMVKFSGFVGKRI